MRNSTVAAFESFKKRKRKLLRSGAPVAYRSGPIPPKMGVQAYFALASVVGEIDYSLPPLSIGVDYMQRRWKAIEQAVLEELGETSLGFTGGDAQQRIQA